MSSKLRRENPPALKYLRYKPYLRREFDYSCAYCEAREPELGGKNRTHIDHFRPKKHFPKLVDVYTNLFYCCPECNQSKGAYWPNYFQKLSHQYILNVCDDDVQRHIDKSGPKWVGKTLVGKWNIVKLMLSSAAQISRRKHRISIQELIENQRLSLDLAKRAMAIARNKNRLGELKLASDTFKRLLEQLRALESKIYADELISNPDSVETGTASRV